MKIFISYKQTGIDKNILDKKLSYLKEKISPFCTTSYCLWIDDKPNFYKKEILLNKIHKKLSNYEVIIFLIDSDEKSEWQLLELWISYSLWKKILLLVKNDIKEKYYLSYATTKNIVYFDNLENLNFKEIEKLLKYNLPDYNY